MLRIGLALSVVLGTIGTIGTVHAQSPAVQLAEAREQILYARYQEAIESIEGLLQNPSLDAQTRNIALEVLATAHIANRDRDNADRVLAMLYARDPDHRLSDPDASPVVQGAFQRARSRHPTTVDVSLDHTPPILAARESPLIEVRVIDGANAVGEVRLAYRTSDAPRFARLVMNVDPETGIARGRIPLVGAPEAEQLVQYYIIALAPSMTPLAQLGDEAEPMQLSVPAQRGPDRNPDPDPDPDPVTPSTSTSKWWVGLIVGIAAVGLGVGGYFLFREEAPNGSLGNASLR